MWEIGVVSLRPVMASGADATGTADAALLLNAAWSKTMQRDFSQ